MEESRLARLSLDRCREMMFWVGGNGDILFANDTASRLLERSPEELGRSKYIDLFLDYTPEKFSRQWEAVRHHGGLEDASTLAMRTGPGMETEIEWSYIPYPGGECAFIILRDNAERKKSEAALRKSEDQMRQAQRMETVGRLAGGIAHDFNNSLSVISGYANLLQLRLARTGSSHRELAEIEKAVLRAASVVRQLLTFSRKQPNHPQFLDIGPVFREILGAIESMLGEDILLKTRMGAALGKIFIDRNQLDQVILNLALNSREAMPRGGSLDFEIAACVLESGDFRPGEANEPGNYIKLTVRDSGIGMTAATQARLFEPFFTTKGEGRGMGLSTVYGIVRQAGGIIRYESEAGHGTTITVFLPHIPSTDSGGDGRTAEAEKETGGKGETVLLVEDDADLRKLTKDILVLGGYRVLEGRDVEEAARMGAAEELPVDILLTDVVMPRMNGLDLAKIIGAKRPGMGLIFMSGYTSHALTPEGGWGEYRFLSKPFPAAKLLAEVRAALDAAKAGKQL